MGADVMAGAIAYFTLAYCGYYIPLAAFAAFDLAYYGPQILGAQSAGVIAAMALF